jgi:hypothetical protein
VQNRAPDANSESFGEIRRGTQATLNESNSAESVSRTNRQTDVQCGECIERVRHHPFSAWLINRRLGAVR